MDRDTNNGLSQPLPQWRSAPPVPVESAPGITRCACPPFGSRPAQKVVGADRTHGTQRGRSWRPRRIRNVNIALTITVRRIARGRQDGRGRNTSIHRQITSRLLSTSRLSSLRSAKRLPRLTIIGIYRLRAFQNTLPTSHKFYASPGNVLLRFGRICIAFI